MSIVESPRGEWDAQRRAQVLTGRRDRLLARLPQRIASAHALSADVRALVVDDAITFVAIEWEQVIVSRRELELVFWDAAAKRVKRACEGRYDMLRAGYQRADLAALEGLAVDATPESATLQRAELSAAVHFVALLEPRERDVFLCRQREGRRKALGDAAVARKLGVPLNAVRAAQRSIEHKHERFATIYTAGRLCGYLAPAIAALAAGDSEAQQADSGRELAARVHLEVEHCSTCVADYARQLRYLRGARFQHQVAILLPAGVDERVRAAGRLAGREWLPDWLARLLAHEPASTAAQLLTGGAGRGLTGAAAAKLATFCIAGAGAVGACVATGVLPLQTLQSRPPALSATPTATASPRAAPVAPEPRLPHGVSTPTPTPTPRPRKRRPTVTPAGATQGATGSRSHEQAPASPAPANASPGGASEFDPSYQPSAPAAPAPVPAAPGASEFS